MQFLHVFIMMVVWIRAQVQLDPNREVEVVHVTPRFLGDTILNLGPYAPDPEVVVDKIVQAIAADEDHHYYGLRGEWDTDPQYKPGDTMAFSYDWIDGEQTDQELDGTCAVRIPGEWGFFDGTDQDEVQELREDIQKALKLIRQYGDGHVALIAGSDVMAGEDFGEGIFSAHGYGNDGATYIDRLYQSGNAPRGSIRFLNDGEVIIRFFQAADLSTAPHEIFHLFRRDLEQVANNPDAPDAVRVDWRHACNFVDVKPGEVWTREQEETFADAGLAYLMEGNSPSKELRGVFDRLRKWLVSIYYKVSRLGVRLTPEMRGVFDRMLATEAEIEQAKKGVSLEHDHSPDTLPGKAQRAAVVAAHETVRKKMEHDRRTLRPQWRAQAEGMEKDDPRRETARYVREVKLNRSCELASWLLPGRKPERFLL